MRMEGWEADECGALLSVFCRVFFFQAEDGIRDYKVTGVQTCALPISSTVGSIIMPACSGEKPRQTCRTSGIRKGMQELPRRENRLPSRPTRRLRTANSSEIGRASCRERV